MTRSPGGHAARILPGVALAAALAAWGRFADVGEALLGVALAIVVPLGVELANEGGPSALVAMVPFGAAAGLLSFGVPPGPLSGVLALGWLATTLGVAALALGRVLRRGLGPIEELAIDAGHAYLPVGAVWLTAHRWGAPLGGFVEPIVLYTADHFHFAGFAAPVVAGLLGREIGLRRRPGTRDPIVRGARASATRASILLVMAGVPLVALGIVVSHRLELPAALTLGAGMTVLATLLVDRGVARARRGDLTGLALVGAGLSLFVSMALAVAFTFTGTATRGGASSAVPYATMARLHGSANAIGFATLALVAFTARPPTRRSGPFGGTWPRLFSRGAVGVDFYRRVGAIEPDRAVRGQVAHLHELAHDGFHPERVDPRIRDFYEQTAAWTLRVDPRWHAPFRWLAPLYRRIAERLLGNLVLPVSPEGDDVTTELFAVRSDVDGRPSPRGYVRAYGAGSSRTPNYVAAYATHRGAARTLLSCAFPLPRSSLSAVLRFDDAANGGLTLSSRPRPDEGPADEGMFLVTKWGPLRLPVDERLTVTPEGEEIVALHETHVLWLPCFTLRYRLTRATPRPAEGQDSG